MASLRSWTRLASLTSAALVAGLALAAATLTGACLTLDDISENVCGNRVLDPGEDCDTTKETVANGYKGTCTAAGSANECRFPVACDLREPGCSPQCAADVEGCVAQCPSGFRAGLDGICRRPSGVFADPPTPVPFAGIEPYIVDLDGDGEKDLMVDGQDREHLAFMQAGNVRGTTEIRKRLNASVSVGRLTQNSPTPDIVIPTGTTRQDGFALYRGTVGGPPDAYTFPSYDLGAPFRIVPVSSMIYGDPKHVDTFSAGLLLDCPNASPTSLCKPAGLANHQVVVIDPAVPTPSDWKRTAPLPLASTFAPTTVKSSRILTLPFRNADNGCVDTLVVPRAAPIGDLRIIHPCGAGQTIPTATVAAPLLPSDCDVMGLMSARSTSGDHDDVYASLECGQVGSRDQRLARLYYPTAGEANLRPGCLSGGPCIVTQEKNSCPMGVARRVLSVGDFNADGDVDYAASDGIYFGNAIDPGFAAALPPDQPADFACWKAAFAADLNADGVVDLAAAPAGEAGLSVVLGAKQSVLSAITLGTGTEAIEASVGDFDGDGTKDIAVALDASSGETCDDQLPSDIAVFYGRPQGFPEEARVIGAVPSVAQLSAGVLYRDATGLANDGQADLAAITQRDIEGCKANRGSLFPGSATRSMVTPYSVIVRARGILTTQPDIRAIGIVDTAFSNGPQLAVVENSGSKGQTPFIDVIRTSEGETLIPESNCPVLVTSEDNCDEIRSLDLGGAVAAATIVALDDRLAAAGTILEKPGVQVVVHNGKTIGDFFALASYDPGFIVERLTIEVGDFDGDGRSDLAVLAFDRRNVIETPRSHVQIFLADTLVPNGQGCQYGDTNANIVGFASVDIGGPGGIVVSTTLETTGLLGIDASCQPTGTFPLPPLPLEGNDIQSIAVGDLNADGIDDIAISAHDRTLVLRQSTTTEYERTKPTAPPPEE